MAAVDRIIHDVSREAKEVAPGLLGLLQRPDVGLATAGAIVFGVQRLVPTYDNTWYQNLRKPKWTPKNWVFPAVWIPLKIMQSAALWLVYKSAAGRPAKELAAPLAAFAAHLALGNVWNVIFFGRRRLEESLPWMASFWASTGLVAATFNQVDQLAAGLMLPTAIWVTIAAKLNWDIVKLNADEARKSKQQPSLVK